MALPMPYIINCDMILSSHIKRLKCKVFYCSYSFSKIAYLHKSLCLFQEIAMLDLKAMPSPLAKLRIILCNVF